MIKQPECCVYYLVNVFCDNKLASLQTGNPLAVFLPQEPLSAALMQLIARQMNLSETVFLTIVDQQPSIRIFTLGTELAFAGHPLLGSAFVYLLTQQQVKLTTSQPAN